MEKDSNVVQGDEQSPNQVPIGDQSSGAAIEAAKKNNKIELPVLGEHFEPRLGTDRRNDPLTRQQADELAERLGYNRVKDAPFNPHGQPVYRSGNSYISPDVDGHNGGTWKVFDKKGNRVGTFDSMLQEKIGK